ncbi:hypothetical protein K9L97_04825 [Candidatus Woesearchaeota archaeon]|nr:hypothetical protein [Candidatus Woesearchaeota archaeon]
MNKQSNTKKKQNKSLSRQVYRHLLLSVVGSAICVGTMASLAGLTKQWYKKNVWPEVQRKIVNYDFDYGFLVDTIRNSDGEIKRMRYLVRGKLTFNNYC